MMPQWPAHQWVLDVTTASSRWSRHHSHLHLVQACSWMYKDQDLIQIPDVHLLAVQLSLEATDIQRAPGCNQDLMRCPGQHASTQHLVHLM